MDVTVKQAFERLRAACVSIDTAQSKEANDRKNKMQNLLAKDICAFIYWISNSGAAERYDYFNKIYQGGQFPASDVQTTKTESLPLCFTASLDYDKKLLKKTSVSVAELYTVFLTELGKHYSFSKHDKKEIDVQKYIDYIRLLNDSLPITREKKQNKSSRSTSNSTSCKTIRSADQPTVSTRVTIHDTEDSSEPDDEETLEKLMEKLNALIGLSGVKAEVSSLINLLKIKRIRDERGMKTAGISKHLVFLGNPGTGKTNRRGELRPCC